MSMTNHQMAAPLRAQLDGAATDWFRIEPCLWLRRGTFKTSCCHTPCSESVMFSNSYTGWFSGCLTQPKLVIIIYFHKISMFY